MKKILASIAFSLGTLMIVYGFVQTMVNQWVDSSPKQATKSDAPVFQLPNPQILVQDKQLVTPPPNLPALQPIDRFPENIGFDERIWGELGQSGDRMALLKAIDNSVLYLQSPDAVTAYQKYRIAEITRDRVLRSLQRFRELVRQSASKEELSAAVKKEFVFYQASGRDGLGNVLFTAYYEPVYEASRVPTAEYRYPIYKTPPNLKSWPKPHPTREQLEGKDGLQGSKGKLQGLELFWLPDRFDAYLAHIQGSAKLHLTDGTVTSVSYAGNTAYNYSSIGKALADDGKLPLENLTMPTILNYFQENPQELDNYLPRDRSFVFFRENHGQSAVGILSLPLTAERSIATDKSLMPPGALALINAPFPVADTNGRMQYRNITRYVLDQDAGGAIKGAGRVDYFLGTGKVAGDRAGVTVTNGQLYYLLLKK